MFCLPEKDLSVVGLTGEATLPTQAIPWFFMPHQKDPGAYLPLRYIPSPESNI